MRQISQGPLRQIPWTMPRTTGLSRHCCWWRHSFPGYARMLLYLQTPHNSMLDWTKQVCLWHKPSEHVHNVKQRRSRKYEETSLMAPSRAWVIRDGAPDIFLHRKDPLGVMSLKQVSMAANKNFGWAHRGPHLSRHPLALGHDDDTHQCNSNTLNLFCSACDVKNVLHIVFWGQWFKRKPHELYIPPPLQRSPSTPSPRPIPALPTNHYELRNNEPEPP